ncbi:four helix bundle protein [Dokdonia pacifica]|uniref:Four helix bundle protein n=1 Tax=Dokdonia pacifica TaxID=1627892 RepID=A0A238WVY2_9FLAO|nr:four helix bundle protein [Dokdonia pacifica]GGG24110.1 four helix bundle protein [Dokdonia pacifica]SNR49769.1 four helix bundle protein [Dokdonia pacifica]
MEKPKFKFEDLKVYQKALDFVDYVYVTTNKFPKEEVYGLSSQYKRTSMSIPLNIAEGAGDTDAQFNRYLQMAWDSVKECVVCSSIAKRQGFIRPEEDNEARVKLSEMAKMITSLKKYLRKNN